MVDKPDPSAITVLMHDDASDVPAGLAGDREALARLYERHAPVVLSLCRKFASPSDAEDALQEVFLRAFRRLEQLSRPEGFRAWVYSIARRICSERRRTTRRREHHETEATMRQMELEPLNPSPADAIERAEQLVRLTAALDELADDERLAIHLYYLDADPPTAAAESLGLSRSGYYKLLHRARHRLAKLMREVKTA
ncbi:MAG: RNA polymerase sigma factor [Phycisphaerae bacterium]